VIPWNPEHAKNRSCLPPTWTKEELGKRSSIERFEITGFSLLSSPASTIVWLVERLASQVALTYTASIIVGLAAQ